MPNDILVFLLVYLGQVLINSKSDQDLFGETVAFVPSPILK